MSIAKLLICCLLFVSTSLAGNAQNYMLSNEIPVAANGVALRSAWAGGLNSPQFSSIDLDNDGILDLVAYDRTDGKLLCFRNKGTANQIDYDFAPEFSDFFPSNLSDWVLLRDFDNDGYIDIFTAVPQVSNVRVFRNTSAQTNNVLSFALHTNTIVSSYPPNLDMYSSKSDIPAIEDLDGDGDLDFLTFHVGGTYVEWHKNLSVENTGGLLGMDFGIQSRCFGHFEEDPQTCSAILNLTPCGPGQRQQGPILLPLERPVHSGSTMLAIDIDGNELKDLIIGDIGCSTFYALFNTGSASVAHFSSVEDSFPQQGQMVSVVSFPAPYAVDVNNDGKKDLIAAPNSTSQIEDQNGIQLHLNAGTAFVTDFQFAQFGFMQDQMIENGTAAMPCFWDYDDDGLQDLLIGGAGRFDSLAGFFPILSLYKNIGSAQSPAYELVDNNYLDLRNNADFDGATWIKPTAGDLDGNGTQDLLLGNSDGKIYFLANTASSGNPAVFGNVVSSFAGIDVGINSSPQLVDLNADNDLDLLIGNHRGYIWYFENQGTPTAPNFVQVTDSFGKIKINDFTGQIFSNGYAQPFAVDYDGDSDLDLLVGSIEGPVQVYENVNLSPNAPFFRANDLYGRDFGSYSSPAAAILDSSRLSYVIGDIRGGVSLLRDAGPLAVAEANLSAQNISIFPNPAHDLIQFRLEDVPAGSLSNYSLRNIQGVELVKGAVKGFEGEISTLNLPNGIYLLHFSGKASVVTKRIIVAH